MGNYVPWARDFSPCEKPNFGSDQLSIWLERRMKPVLRVFSFVISCYVGRVYPSINNIQYLLRSSVA